MRTWLICLITAQAYLRSSCSLLPAYVNDTAMVQPCTEGADIVLQNGEPLTDEYQKEAYGVLHTIVRATMFPILEFEELPSQVKSKKVPAYCSFIDWGTGINWKDQNTKAVDPADYKGHFELTLHFEPGTVKPADYQPQLRRWHIKTTIEGEVEQADFSGLYAALQKEFTDPTLKFNGEMLAQFAVGDNHFTYPEDDAEYDPSKRTFAEVFDPTYCACDTTETTTTTTTTTTTSNNHLSTRTTRPWQSTKKTAPVSRTLLRDGSQTSKIVAGSAAGVLALSGAGAWFWFR